MLEFIWDQRIENQSVNYIFYKKTYEWYSE